jgi:quercetin dioxygenase-like cupin family protein
MLAWLGRQTKNKEVKNIQEMNIRKKEEAPLKLKTRGTKLIDMINYQEGSVVSREIVAKKTGTVTLFAFDQGQGLSEHKAPYDALAYCLDGEGKITISGNSVHLMPGEIVIMPAHQPHSLKALKKFKMLLTMIRA